MSLYQTLVIIVSVVVAGITVCSIVGRVASHIEVMKHGYPPPVSLEDFLGGDL